MKTIKKTIILLSVFSFMLMPFRVFADGSYYNLSANECYMWMERTTGNSHAEYYLQTDVNARVVLLGVTNQSTSHIYIISETAGGKYYSRGTTTNVSPCPLTLSNNMTAVTYNNKTYYYGRFESSYNANNIYTIPSYYGTDNVSTAIYYTYGEGATDPEPVINWGNVQNISYRSEIAGSGDASVRNVDTIRWNKFQDTAGNDISQGNAWIEIQAVATYYNSTELHILMDQTTADRNVGEIAVTIQTVDASVGEYSVMWSNVMRNLDLTASDLIPHIKGSEFYCNGWYYQVRLVVPEDNYEGQWYTVYTSTSAAPEDSQVIINSTQISQQLVNVIQQINQTNNSNENWQIQNYEINMQNDDDQTITDKPWWAYLLEALLDLLSTIGDLIGNLIHDLLSLFTFDSFSIPDFEENQNNLIQNTGIFGESLQFTQTIQQTITGAEYVEPIFYYPGISIMGEQLLPQMTFNLNDYVEELGLTDLQNLAYLVTDGMIYLSLILLVHRKVMGVLKS